MNKDILDSFVIKDLNRFDLELKKLIFSNPRKMRFVLLVKNLEGNLCILKWNHPNSNLEHQKKLSNEIKFYNNHKGAHFLPNLLHSEKNLLLLDFVNSLKLRDWIIIYRKKLIKNKEIVLNEFKGLVNNYFNIIEEFYYSKNVKTDVDENFQNMLKKYGRNLIFSGPMHTSRSKIEDFIAKAIYKYFNKTISRSFQKIYNQIINNKIDLYIGEIHSDLHLNNILINKENNNIKIIDWENMEKNYCLLDIQYSFVMIYFLLDGLPKHQKFLQNAAYKFFDKVNSDFKDLFYEIFDILFLSISTNRKFSHNLSFRKIIKHYFLFIPRLHKITLKLNRQ